MSIISTEVVIDQSPGVTSPTPGKGANDGVSKDLSLVADSQTSGESKDNHSAQQAISFSDQLSKVQQNGRNQASAAGNKLPLSNPNLTNVLPEISNQPESGDAQPTNSNNNVSTEGAEQVEFASFDIYQTTNAVGFQQAEFSSAQTAPSAGISLDNFGKMQGSIPLEPTIDRHYETDRFGQSLIIESDNTRTASAEVNNDRHSDVSLPILGIPVHKNLDYQVTSKLPSFQQDPAILLPVGGLAYDKKNSGADIKSVNSTAKNKYTSELLSSNDLSERILDTVKSSGAKNAIGKNASLFDKLELNPNSKLVAQLNKNTSSNIEASVGNAKISNLVGNNLVYVQELGQHEVIQGINSPNLLVGQTNPLANVLNAQTDHNASNILQQGLSLRQNFSPNLANRIQWIYQQAMTSAEILMDPPELGPLSVKLQTNQGETNILFQVSNSHTKEMIEESLAKLREMLEQQGIKLGDTQVEHKESNNDEQEDSRSSHTLASSDLENPQQSDSLVQNLGLLDTYA